MTVSIQVNIDANRSYFGTGEHEFEFAAIGLKLSEDGSQIRLIPQELDLNLYQGYGLCIELEQLEKAIKLLKAGKPELE